MPLHTYTDRALTGARSSRGRCALCSPSTRAPRRGPSARAAAAAARSMRAAAAARQRLGAPAHAPRAEIVGRLVRRVRAHLPVVEAHRDDVAQRRAVGEPARHAAAAASPAPRWPAPSAWMRRSSAAPRRPLDDDDRRRSSARRRVGRRSPHEDVTASRREAPTWRSRTQFHRAARRWRELRTGWRRQPRERLFEESTRAGSQPAADDACGAASEPGPPMLRRATLTSRELHNAVDRAVRRRAAGRPRGRRQVRGRGVHRHAALPGARRAAGARHDGEDGRGERRAVDRGEGVDRGPGRLGDGRGGAGRGRAGRRPRVLPPPVPRVRRGQLVLGGGVGARWRAARSARAMASRRTAARARTPSAARSTTRWTRWARTAAPDATLVDFGCATGVSTRRLAERYPQARSIVGLDLSPHFLAVGRRLQLLAPGAVPWVNAVDARRSRERSTAAPTARRLGAGRRLGRRGEPRRWSIHELPPSATRAVCAAALTRPQAARASVGDRDGALRRVRQAARQPDARARSSARREPRVLDEYADYQPSCPPLVADGTSCIAARVAGAATTSPRRAPSRCRAPVQVKSEAARGRCRPARSRDGVRPTRRADELHTRMRSRARSRRRPTARAIRAESTHPVLPRARRTPASLGPQLPQRLASTRAAVEARRRAALAYTVRRSTTCGSAAAGGVPFYVSQPSQVREVGVAQCRRSGAAAEARGGHIRTTRRSRALQEAVRRGEAWRPRRSGRRRGGSRGDPGQLRWWRRPRRAAPTTRRVRAAYSKGYCWQLVMFRVWQEAPGAGRAVVHKPGKTTADAQYGAASVGRLVELRFVAR